MGISRASTKGRTDIATAFTVAETLVEYRRGEPSNSKPRVNFSKGGGAKFQRPPQNKESFNKPQPNKDWKRDSKVEMKPKDKCFLCDGPH